MNIAAIRIARVADDPGVEFEIIDRKDAPGFEILRECVDLSVAPGVPADVRDCCADFLGSPVNCVTVKPVPNAALTADCIEVGFQPADGLFDLAAALRASDWQDVIVQCRRHSIPSQG